MGTVSSRDSQSLCPANIGTSGQHGTYKTYKTRTHRQPISSIRERTAQLERGCAENSLPVAPRSHTVRPRRPTPVPGLMTGIPRPGDAIAGVVQFLHVVVKIAAVPATENLSRRR